MTTLLHFDPEGEIESASLYVDRRKIVGLDDYRMKRAAAHELGHVLGLDHDESSWSVMFGKVRGTPFELSKKDRKLLRSAYARRAA
jgi:predicted Zn-dependent protease